MKISCCWMYAIGNYGYPPSMDNMFRAIGEMADLGFEYIELEGLGYENLQQVIDHTPRLKQRCDDFGLRVSNLLFCCPILLAWIPEHRRRRLICSAAELRRPLTWVLPMSGLTVIHLL